MSFWFPHRQLTQSISYPNGHVVLMWWWRLRGQSWFLRPVLGGTPSLVKAHAAFCGLHFGMHFTYRASDSISFSVNEGWK